MGKTVETKDERFEQSASNFYQQQVTWRVGEVYGGVRGRGGEVYGEAEVGGEVCVGGGVSTRRF